jgi:isochorismate synthase EntC
MRYFPDSAVVMLSIRTALEPTITSSSSSITGISTSMVLQVPSLPNQMHLQLPFTSESQAHTTLQPTPAETGTPQQHAQWQHEIEQRAKQ